MTHARAVATAAAGFLLTAAAGCVMTHGNLESSADRLENNAAALAQNLRAEPPSDAYPGGASRDASELAERAHDFRLTVEDRRAESGDVKSAFERVSRSYHALRDDVDHLDSHAARVDLRPVTEAYLDVEREMGGYPEHHRYASD